MKSESQQYVQDDEIDLGDILLKLWEGKGIILSITFMCLLIACTYIYFNKGNFSASLDVLPVSISEMSKYEGINSIDTFKVSKRETSLKSERMNFLEFYNIDKEKFLKEYKGKGFFSFVNTNEGSLSSEYKGINSSDAFKVSKEKLLTLFIERLRTKEDLIDAVKKLNFVERKNYRSDAEFEKSVLDVVYKFNVLPSKAKSKDVFETPDYKVKFKGIYMEAYIPLLKFALESANESVRLKVLSDFDKKIEIKRRQDKYSIESIDKSIANARDDYEREISRRVAFLKEQAVLARSLGIAKSKIEGIAYSIRNVPLEGVKVESPYYLWGYEAIEKEIDLLLSRESKDFFIQGLSELYAQKRDITQNSFLEEIVDELNMTPLKESKEFKSASFNVDLIELDKKVKPLLIIFLSIFVGFFISAFIILCIAAVKSRRENQIKKG